MTERTGTRRMEAIDKVRIRRNQIPVKMTFGHAEVALGGAPIQLEASTCGDRQYVDI